MLAGEWFSYASILQPVAQFNGDSIRLKDVYSETTLFSMILQ